MLHDPSSYYLERVTPTNVAWNYAARHCVTLYRLYSYFVPFDTPVFHSITFSVMLPPTTVRKTEFHKDATEVRGDVVELHARRSRVRFPMRSLGFLIALILPVALWPLDDSASNKTQHQGSSLECKDSRCVELTSLPISCVDFLEIQAVSTSWNPRDLYKYTFSLPHLHTHGTQEPTCCYSEEYCSCFAVSDGTRDNFYNMTNPVLL